MSCVVKTATPFIDANILCKALESMGHRCSISGNIIVTDIKDYMLGHQEFRRDSNGRFSLYAYSHTDRNKADFILKLDGVYQIKYQEYLDELERQRQEEERIRMENERKAFVEKQRTSVIEKAKKLGYTVQEKKVDNKIKLVLVRHTY